MHAKHGLIQMGVFVQMWIWKVKKYLWFHVLSIYPISTWGILAPFKVLIILIAFEFDFHLYFIHEKKNSFLIFIMQDFLSILQFLTSCVDVKAAPPKCH
jgi:hypothetical protein